VNLAIETAPVSDADKKSVAVTCQLTQSYRVASPLLLNDARIATVFNATTNRTEMFLIRDVSTTEQNDLHVFWLGADGIGDTGWRLVDLAFPSQAAAIMAGIYPDGSRIVFVIDATDVPRQRSSSRGDERHHVRLVLNGDELSADEIWEPLPSRSARAQAVKSDSSGRTSRSRRRVRVDVSR
jgi:hypothetical protein